MMVPIIEYEIPNLNNEEKKCIIIFESCSCLFVFFVLLSFFHPPKRTHKRGFKSLTWTAMATWTHVRSLKCSKRSFPLITTAWSRYTDSTYVLFVYASVRGLVVYLFLSSFVSIFWRSPLLSLLHFYMYAFTAFALALASAFFCLLPSFSILGLAAAVAPVGPFDGRQNPKARVPTAENRFIGVRPGALCEDPRRVARRGRGAASGCAQGQSGWNFWVFSFCFCFFFLPWQAKIFSPGKKGKRKKNIERVREKDRNGMRVIKRDNLKLLHFFSHIFMCLFFLYFCCHCNVIQRWQQQRAWFAYFDEDNSGELSQAEVVRGLIKSFHLGSDLRTVQEMKDTVRETGNCKNAKMGMKEQGKESVNEKATWVFLGGALGVARVFFKSWTVRMPLYDGGIKRLAGKLNRRPTCNIFI